MIGVLFNKYKKLRWRRDVDSFPLLPYPTTNPQSNGDWNMENFGYDRTHYCYTSSAVSGSDGKFSENEIPTLMFYFMTPERFEPSNGITVISRYLESDSIYSNIKQIRISFNGYETSEYSLREIKNAPNNPESGGGIVEPFCFDHYNFDTTEAWALKIEILSVYEPNKKATLSDIEVSFSDKIAEYNKFLSFEIYENINILSDDVAVNTCNFTVKTDSNETTITENDEFNAYKYDNSFKKLLGRFRVTNCEQIADKIFEITAEDMKSKAKKFQYDSWCWIYPERCIPEISEACGVGIEAKKLNLKSFTGYVKPDSCLYGLCQFAWAANKMIDSSRASFITLRDIPTKITSYINNNNGRKKIIGDAKFKKSETFTHAIYKLFQYKVISGDETEIGKIKGYFPSETRYDFPDPPFYSHRNMLSDTLMQFKFTDNFITFKTVNTGYSENDITTIYGNKIVPTTTEIIVENTSVQNSANNEKVYDRYTLAQGSGAGYSTAIDVKSPYIKKFIESPGTVSAKIVVENERVGDLVQIETAFSGTFTGIITSMVLHLGYTDVADIEVRVWPYEGGLG